MLALRAAGHDVVAVCETRPGEADAGVLAWADAEHRIVLTEDRDFGALVFAAQADVGSGVVFIRCPESVRPRLPKIVVSEVDRLSEQLAGAFVLWTPGRTRVRKPRPASS